MLFCSTLSWNHSNCSRRLLSLSMSTYQLFCPIATHPHTFCFPSTLLPLLSINGSIYSPPFVQLMTPSALLSLYTTSSPLNQWLHLLSSLCSIDDSLCSALLCFPSTLLALLSINGSIYSPPFVQLITPSALLCSAFPLHYFLSSQSMAPSTLLPLFN